MSSPSSAEPGSAAEGTPKAPTPPGTTGRDTILIVEDNEVVANLALLLLSNSAPRLLRAHNGAEAERLFAENHARISLAMIDCWLPDIPGSVLTRRFRIQDPGLPVLLTSGFEEANSSIADASAPTMFIPKPYFPNELRRTVATLVAARRG